MAAYASIVSVMHTIDQIQHHPHTPICLDKTQVESLIENFVYLRNFLEDYSPQFGNREEEAALEMRIVDAAYTAEDIIESHIVDLINFDRSISDDGKKFNFGKLFKCFRGLRKAAGDRQFYESLRKVIEDVDSIKEEVMQIRENIRDQDQLLRNSMHVGSLRSSFTGKNMIMVGFDDVFVEIMDNLTGGRPDRQTISIVGMGGIGKTTLARNIYQHQVIVQHFDVCAWVTISQEYRMREILLELLREGGGDFSKVNEYKLSDELHKKLWGRRYLIIMDGIWNIDLWDQLRSLFPDNKNGSRIVITTRVSNFEFANTCVFQMRFLDEDKSWSLFSKIVFDEEDCPLELEKIGKKIVENCRGLPLSIIVVGGLLAKSEQTREYWEYIAENLNAVVNSEEEDRCFKILYMSYKQLPVSLKPCFLYMGVFSEDKKIRVSELIKLWVAEGFLKPNNNKSLEEVGYEYLNELINRNLVLVHELGCTGNIKYCKIHDLLRDLCLRQAEKERFYNIIRRHSPNVQQDASTRRRIVIPEHTSRKEVHIALQSTSPARSLICDSKEVVPLSNFRLLRIMSCSHYQYSNFQEVMFKLVNSRCLVFRSCWGSLFPSSFYPLWNLQTLVVGSGGNSAPFEIWSMPHLRHIKFVSGFQLPELRRGKFGRQDDFVLENLQTLGTVINFKCSEEIIKSIPNIRKLRIRHMRAYEDGWLNFRVSSFIHLRKLESFSCRQTPMSGGDYLDKITFPHSLKKLTLNGRCIIWENMLEKVSSLPLLEKFILEDGYFEGGRWETVEGQFCSLKFLSIQDCRDLLFWTTESSHFPRLEHLVLKRLEDLEEIPSEIGEITTLKSIKLVGCSNPIVVSAKKIEEKQEELYGEVGLQLQIQTRDPNVAYDF